MIKVRITDNCSSELGLNTLFCKQSENAQWDIFGRNSSGEIRNAYKIEVYTDPDSYLIDIETGERSDTFPTYHTKGFNSPEEVIERLNRVNEDYESCKRQERKIEFSRRKLRTHRNPFTLIEPERDEEFEDEDED